MARYRSSNGQSRPYKDGDRWIHRVEQHLPDGRIVKAAGSSRRNREECLARAEANLARKVEEARQEKLAQTPASSVATWLAYWMASKTNLKPKTKVSYVAAIDKRINPAIGSKALADVTIDDIEAIHRRILDDGCSRTVWATVKTVLKQAFDDAVKRGHADRSPVLHAPALQPKKRSEVWLTPEEAARVIDGSEHTSDTVRWTFALHLGLRQGEALALRWRDLDIDGSYPRVAVYGSLSRETGRGLVYGSTKTHQRRDLPLTTRVVELLRRHRLEQRARFLGYGIQWTEDAPVIAAFRRDATVGPVDPANDRKKWIQALVHAGVPKVRLHDARHTAATIMLSGGVDMFTVSKLLGHSSIQTTIDTYGHLPTAMLQAAVQASDDVFERARAALG